MMTTTMTTRIIARIMMSAIHHSDAPERTGLFLSGANSTTDKHSVFAQPIAFSRTASGFTDCGH